MSFSCNPSQKIQSRVLIGRSMGRSWCYNIILTWYYNNIILVAIQLCRRAETKCLPPLQAFDVCSRETCECVTRTCWEMATWVYNTSGKVLAGRGWGGEGEGVFAFDRKGPEHEVRDASAVVSDDLRRIYWSTGWTRNEIS